MANEQQFKDEQLLLEAATHDYDMLSLTIGDLETKLQMQDIGKQLNDAEIQAENQYALVDKIDLEVEENEEALEAEVANMGRLHAQEQFAADEEEKKEITGALKKARGLKRELKKKGAKLKANLQQTVQAQVKAANLEDEISKKLLGTLQHFIERLQKETPDIEGKLNGLKERLTQSENAKERTMVQKMVDDTERRLQELDLENADAKENVKELQDKMKARASQIETRKKKIMRAKKESLERQKNFIEELKTRAMEIEDEEERMKAEARIKRQQHLADAEERKMSAQQTRIAKEMQANQSKLEEIEQSFKASEARVNSALSAEKQKRKADLERRKLARKRKLMQKRKERERADSKQATPETPIATEP